MILATLVYIVKDGKTLMIHRCKRDGDNHKGKYNGLGGKFEAGETALECAKREVFEESGLEISKIQFKGHILFPKFDPQGNDWFVFLYVAHDFSGAMKNENPEGVLEWVPNDKLLDLPLWEGDKHFLKHLFEDSFIEGKFFYENKRLVRHELVLLPTHS